MNNARLNVRQVMAQVPHWQTKYAVNDLKTIFLLTSNAYTNSKYDYVIALGKLELLTINHVEEKKSVFERLKEKKGLWKFPIIAYDYKNHIEDIHSKQPNRYPFSDFSLYIPEVVITCKNDFWQVYLQRDNSISEIDFKPNPKVEVQDQFFVKSLKFPSFQEYEDGFNRILHHLYRGDFYETNYCNLFQADTKGHIPAEELFVHLNEISSMSMACFVKLNNVSICCASPERYIQKTGNRLISSPIKGSARRGSDEASDTNIETELKNSEKEQAENVMIVDLVRNDLSKIAKKNTVKVENMFRIEKLPNIFQMVSDVSCELKNEVSFEEILDATFPMGSMTGAPKISAMKIMDDIETFKRGIYSGVIGYIEPNGDFDLNVVIRSIIIHDNTLYYPVGSAITAYADAAKEYQECLLKAKAFFTLLQQYGYHSAHLGFLS